MNWPKTPLSLGWQSALGQSRHSVLTEGLLLPCGLFHSQISSSLGGQKAGLDFCWCWVWFPSPAGQGTNSTPQSTAIPSSFPNSCSLLCPPQQTPKHNIDAQGGLEGPKQTLAPERLIIYKWTAVDKKIRACVAGIQPWYAESAFSSGKQSSGASQVGPFIKGLER